MLLETTRDQYQLLLTTVHPALRMHVLCELSSNHNMHSAISIANHEKRDIFDLWDDYTSAGKS